MRYTTPRVRWSNTLGCPTCVVCQLSCWCWPAPYWRGASRRIPLIFPHCPSCQLSTNGARPRFTIRIRTPIMAQIQPRGLGIFSSVPKHSEPRTSISPHCVASSPGHRFRSWILAPVRPEPGTPTSSRGNHLGPDTLRDSVPSSAGGCISPKLRFARVPDGAVVCQERKCKRLPKSGETPEVR